MHDIPE